MSKGDERFNGGKFQRFPKGTKVVPTSDGGVRIVTPDESKKSVKNPKTNKKKK